MKAGLSWDGCGGQGAHSGLGLGHAQASQTRLQMQQLSAVSTASMLWGWQGGDLLGDSCAGP